MTETKQKGKSEPVWVQRKVSMTEELWDYLDGKVEEKGFNSTSSVIRHAIRKCREEKVGHHE
jgi:Arc/MetJ-type ribon-helix-helix transcriptional regulator